MKTWYLLLLPMLILAKDPALASFSGGYIRVQPVSCQSNTMKISVFTPITGFNDLIPSPTIYFGDGVSESLAADTTFIVKKFSDHIGIKIYSVEHTYAGPGHYTVSYQSFNRYANINNMSNSVNTPGYLETTFTIDPFLGCVETPQIENFSYSIIRRGGDFIYDLVASTAGQDSLHYSFEVPWQDKDVHVINYSYPTSYDETGQKAISKMGIDPNNGLLYWPNANNPGNFVWDVRIKQYRKVDGQVYLVGSTLVDLTVRIDSTSKDDLEFTGLRDTAVVAGTALKLPFALQGGAKDQLKIMSFGDVFQPTAPAATVGLADSMYYAPPKAAVMNWNTTAALARGKPYKFCLMAIEKNTGTMAYGSAYIWLTGQSSHPEAPTALQAFAEEASRVNLTWQDNSTDEEGFIVERADEHHPGFMKISTLPANAVACTDQSTLPETQYRYRVKAVGTAMSGYSNVAEVETPVVTGLEEVHVPIHRMAVFPNPVQNALNIQWADGAPGPVGILITDYTGRVFYQSSLKPTRGLNHHVLENMAFLPAGLYLCQVDHGGRREIVKFVKR